MFSQVADVGYQSGYEVNKSTLHMYTCWFVIFGVAFMQRMCVCVCDCVCVCTGGRVGRMVAGGLHLAGDLVRPHP